MVMMKTMIIMMTSTTMIMMTAVMCDIVTGVRLLFLLCLKLGWSLSLIRISLPS